MFDVDFKNKVSFKLEDVEVIPMTFKDNIEREIVKDTQSSEEPEGGKDPKIAQNEPSGAHFVAKTANSPTASVKEAVEETTDGNSETQTESVASVYSPMRVWLSVMEVARLVSMLSKTWTATTVARYVRGHHSADSSNRLNNGFFPRLQIVPSAVHDSGLRPK